jgi:hypothetical protein
MVLVATSVWIRFLAGRTPCAAELDRLLGLGEVAGPALVYGELLIGDRGSRRKLLWTAPFFETVARCNTCFTETVFTLAPAQAHISALYGESSRRKAAWKGGCGQDCPPSKQTDPLLSSSLVHQLRFEPQRRGKLLSGESRAFLDH